MKRNSRNTLAAAVVLALATGCAGTPEQQPVTGYDEFYDGTRAAHATDMPATSAPEALAKGDRALQDGDVDLALYRYVQALRHGPSVAAFHRIGGIHLERANYPMAARAFRLGIESDRSHAGVREGFGLVLLHQRRYDEAKIHLEKAIQLDMKLWRAHNALGVIADLENDARRADWSYEAALRLAPQSPKVLNNLGYSAYLAGENSKALDYLRRAVAVQPNYAQGWRNLGLVYSRTGEYERALAAFERVGTRAAAYNNIGYVCLKEGRDEEALRFLRKAAELSPSYYKTAHENMAKLD